MEREERGVSTAKIRDRDRAGRMREIQLRPLGHWLGTLEEPLPLLGQMTDAVTIAAHMKWAQRKNRKPLIDETGYPL